MYGERFKGSRTYKSGAVIAIVLLVSLVIGCSPSGVWEDDPANWKRVFHFDQPDDLFVTHSWYWKSPHFFHEFEYFFEIEHNDLFKRALFEQNELERVIENGERENSMTFFNEKPSWFVPKPIGLYEIWVHAAKTDSNLKIFIDVETGNIFITDYSV